MTEGGDKMLHTEQTGGQMTPNRFLLLNIYNNTNIFIIPWMLIVFVIIVFYLMQKEKSIGVIEQPSFSLLQLLNQLTTNNSVISIVYIYI